VESEESCLEDQLNSSKRKSVVKQDWIESERGWGIRPDGCSLHFSLEDHKEFVKEYWDRMPDEVPDEYSRPSGEPYVVMVDEEVYVRIGESKNGIRKY